jgi:outer membrane protein TolC
LIAYFQSLVQLQALQQAKDAAERAANVSVEQYKEGLVDFNTVVSTLRTLLGQQDQLASIQGTVAINLVEVYRSLGGGWETRQRETGRDIVPKDIRKEMRERGGYWGDAPIGG